LAGTEDLEGVEEVAREDRIRRVECPPARNRCFRIVSRRSAKRSTEVVVYQPANRYWAFQWYELAIYLGAALLLAGFCLWWVRRHLS